MNVLLVPGLYGPLPGMETLQRAMYSSVRPLWQSDGHHVRVHQFGWNEETSLKARQEQLLETVDALPDRVYAIGASAGGLAVINTLRQRPEKIAKVVTVASPLSVTQQDFEEMEHTLPMPVPDLLKQAYHEADLFMQAAGPDVLGKVISIHGKRDKRVPTSWSQRPGIKSESLPVRGHGLIIMSAISSYRKRTQKRLAA